MDTYRYEQEQAVITKTGIEFFMQKMPNEAGRVNPHVHSAIEILHIIKGSFHVITDSADVVAGEGSTVLIRSNTVHRIIPLSSGESFYYVLKVKPSLIIDFSSGDNRGVYLLKLALGTSDSRVLWDEEDSERLGISYSITRIAREQEGCTFGHDIAIRTSAAEILLALLRSSGYVPGCDDIEGMTDDTIRRIYDVTVYINSHYSEDLTAAGCAARAFMSNGHFSRCFTRVTGKSFKDYLNSVRVNIAERELLTTDKSVTDIALDCGFNNVSYFISVYKRLKGRTPNDHRKV